MKKKDRQIIFNKYGGRCAYCGIPLLSGWHIDERLPVKRMYSKEFNTKTNRWTRKIIGVVYPERFHIDNQMPSCPSCNVNKRALTLDSFRELISGFTRHLNSHSVQYKIAKRYGLVREEPKPVIFYFEVFKPKSI